MQEDDRIYLNSSLGEDFSYVQGESTEKYLIGVYITKTDGSVHSVGLLIIFLDHMSLLRNPEHQNAIQTPPYEPERQGIANSLD